MSLYAIGDLHLSTGTDKPMDVFGGAWENYTEKIIEGFSIVGEDDTVVLCGDLSWASSLEEARGDFRLVSQLPGRKVLLKGNHDYWWSTVSKMNSFFHNEGIEDIEIIHNNCIVRDGIALCGTRGWYYDSDFTNEHDQKIYLRELMRLETSLSMGRKSGAERIVVFLHYPPLTLDYECKEILDILYDYDVDICCYGHLHGNSHRRAIRGERDGIEFRLVSADYLEFKPQKIL